MQGVVGIGALLVVACWVIVILHRLGFDAFDPARYSMMNATLAISYTIVGISFCGIVVLIVDTLTRKAK